MIPYFPQQVSTRAIVVYLASLGMISLFFWNYAMGWMYVVLGIAWVTGFFLLTGQWSKAWCEVSKDRYITNIVTTAFVLRVIWVIASFYYYKRVTGIPFELDAADAIGYHEEAMEVAALKWSDVWLYYFGSFENGISDTGYPLYLSVLYRIFGPNLMIPRLIKAVLSTFTCFFLYKLSSRTFGEETGRMIGIMAALMPSLVIYCGYHLKETEMLFLESFFLERMDFLLRNRKLNVSTIVVPTLLALSLFFFRTVLGAAAVLAAATGILISSAPGMKVGWRRVALIGWGLMSLIVLSRGTIMTEIEGYWEQKDENVVNKRMQQTVRGNQWAKYATGSVMAPMVFVLPLSTMVSMEGQENQLTKHGGNFIRNFMGFFAILAVVNAFKRKKMREFALIGAFTITYLGIVSMSGFSNSERFLLPGLPGLLMMWGYGVSTISKTSLRTLSSWCLFVFVMEFGWAFFKLGSRGLF